MRTLTVAAALILSPLALSAQSASATPVNTGADTSAVMAPIHRLFDGMRAHDSTMVRSAFAPETRMASSSTRTGTPTIESESVDGFVNAVGKPSTDKWDERISDPVVHVDDGLAMVWVKYSFYLNDKFSHCGVDAFLLAQGADGWKIVSLGDTRRREGC
ncbi:MAG TPA: nuclear transport factor 2 family protein [Gemmatimonadales bacterium]|jgi:hypothetical protein|nr:nuclear transport factor 2 family protein [Gemmatimonadales bacterium]